MLERYFKLTQHQTDLKTEAIAGLTTFMTMAYILVVNPAILSTTGMDSSALITATGLSAIIATLTMGLYANFPFALAPGMGLNAFFAFTVVQAMGYSWQFALTAVFLEGLIFMLLTFLNIREAIFNSIPVNLKHAVSVGIGLFIAFIGLVNAGVIESGKFYAGEGRLEGLIVQLGDVTAPGPAVALLGILFTGLLLAKRVKGALLLGIIFTTILGMFWGIAHLPSGGKIVSLPPALAPTFLKFDFSQVFSGDMLLVLFTFLFVDMFDTVGTLAGVAAKTGMMDEEGKFPGVNRALFADALGTSVGAILGTSTVTTYIESTSGIAEGGRTGLTAIFTALFFALALFFTPLIQLVPAAATAPALVLVGLFMMSSGWKINWDDYTEAVPAFMTILMMPLTYSISEGIIFGMLSYVGLKLLAGRFRDISPLAAILAVAFLAKLLL